MRAMYNLGDLFDPSSVGDRVALIDCRDWDKPQSYTYARIDELADACARGLLKRGLERGSAVAILSANRAEFLVAYLGAMRAGLVAVPVNFRFPPDTIGYIMRDAGVELVLYDAECRASLPAGVPAIGFDDPGPDGFQALLDPGPFETVRPEPGEPAMVLYTSGSSGRPKGVPLSHDGQLWTVEQRIRAGSFANERLLIAAPLFHMNGLGTAKFAFAAGASLVAAAALRGAPLHRGHGPLPVHMAHGRAHHVRFGGQGTRDACPLRSLRRQVRAHGLRAGDAAADRRHQGMFSERVDLARLRHDRVGSGGVRSASAGPSQARYGARLAGQGRRRALRHRSHGGSRRGRAADPDAGDDARLPEPGREDPRGADARRLVHDGRCAQARRRRATTPSPGGPTT